MISKIRKIPNHVAVIQDGNRRYAWMRALPVEVGHALGAEKAMDLVEWLIRYGVKNITLYLFSTENFKRSEYEIRQLEQLFLNKLTDMANDKRVHDNKIHIAMIGDRKLVVEKFSLELLECIEKLEQVTSGYSDYNLRLAIAYGGRNEIDTNLNHTLQDTPVDIIMRTAGDYRTSNFLSVQANGHSALLYITKKLFPSLKKRDVKKMLKFYNKWNDRV